MSYEVVWSRRAMYRLCEIRDHIAQDAPVPAERLATRIVALTELLSNHPHLGRRRDSLGDRELVVSGTPYIIRYNVKVKRVIIQTIWHASRGPEK